MTSRDKIEQLRQIIANQLNGLIDRDYYLLELPYYTNIGDTLIWQGEEEYLQTIPFSCKGRYSLETFDYPEIGSETMILFQGGGNFGDLWTRHHDFKMQVVEKYPQCKVLFFPQTVYFQKNENLQHCAEFLSHYPNVIICARDNHSYDILQASFTNKIILVPDMAFCIKDFECKQVQPTKKALLLKRNDAELKEANVLSSIANNTIDIRDWPTMERRDIWTQILIKGNGHLPKKWINWYCVHIYRPYLLRCGYNFLSPYSIIYTTRLHGAILGVLMNKKVVMLDNSYGKNKDFYNTWLSDMENIAFLE